MVSSSPLDLSVRSVVLFVCVCFGTLTRRSYRGDMRYPEARVRWLSLPTGLLTLHVLANVVWIGAILSVALVASQAPSLSSAAEAGGLARRLYLRLAVPGFVVSFAAGLSRLLLQPSIYGHLPWMHAKLTCALVVIALHHIIGARVRRMADGRSGAGQGMPLLALLTFAAAAGAVGLGVFKSLP
jgi:putative membrane protein